MAGIVVIFNFIQRSYVSNGIKWDTRSNEAEVIFNSILHPFSCTVSLFLFVYALTHFLDHK